MAGFTQFHVHFCWVQCVSCGANEDEEEEQAWLGSQVRQVFRTIVVSCVFAD